MSKLEEMLKYVSEHNEFYKNRIKEYGIKDPLDINQWPILTRKELQENRYNMFSDGFSEKYYSKKLIRTHTSGSSGQPVNVYWDEKDYNYASTILWRMRKKFYKISPNDRMVKFSLDLIADNNYVYLRDNVMSVSTLVFNSVSEMNDVFVMINKFSPSWISIYPHVLEILCNYYEQNIKLIPKGLRYIETVGEKLDDRLKSRSQLLFNIPVKNLYGSEEVRSIAYECPAGNLHVFSGNVFVDTLKCKEGNNCFEVNKGKAIVTSLSNRAMPLIRYDLEDSIEVIQNFECNCGICSPLIKNIDGRINESFTISDKRIDSILLKDIIHKLNNYFADPIQKYQFLFYKSSNNLQVYLKLSHSFYNWQEEIRKAFLDELSYITGQSNNITISFFFNDLDNIISKKRQILKVLE